ncbi:MAG: helix-hairpin-helix domain-containing protein [Prevotella sp.]|nr:helix-hairpin-helix domain-containing protein [Prevotella sp.]
MLREFFYINKSDRRIIIALLAVIVVALAVVHIFGNGDDSKPTAAVQANDDAEEAVPVADTLFAFDPNTADSTTLLRLGLPRRIVTNLLRYRRAGGVFSEKQDFARLYDLTVGQYQRLEPYIQIAPEFRPASTLYPRQTRHGDYGHYDSGRYDEAGSNADGSNADSAAVAPRYSNKLQPGETIALCDADTTMLRRIPGIGSYYARRIVEYGERLGGYVSLQQLSEIDDIPPQAADYLTLGEPHPRQLNLNTLSLNELKRHPYINYYQARAIVDYRRQHGAIRSLDQLSLLPDFTADAIERLRPYVTF